jgi:endoglucanase
VVPEKELAKIPEEIRQEIKWATGYFDKARLSREIGIPVEVASELNLPLYCGEFGVYSTAPEDPALRWYKDLTEVFRENNIAYSHWCYKGDFSIVDEQSIPKQNLVDLLVK